MQATLTLRGQSLFETTIRTYSLISYLIIHHCCSECSFPSSLSGASLMSFVTLLSKFSEEAFSISILESTFFILWCEFFFLQAFLWNMWSNISILLESSATDLKVTSTMFVPQWFRLHLSMSLSFLPWPLCEASLHLSFICRILWKIVEYFQLES